VLVVTVTVVVVAVAVVAVTVGTTLPVQVALMAARIARNSYPSDFM
jgi:hypothetical protein